MSPAPRPSSTANSSNSLSSLFTLLPSPVAEFCCYLGETNAARHKQNKQVINEIRDLSSQASTVIVLCSYDRLGRLFASLLEDFVQTFFEEVRRLGTSRSLTFAALNQLVKLIEQ